MLYLLILSAGRAMWMLHGLTSKFGRINFRGELFSNLLSFAGTATVRLVSSLVLTRLLYPEAYGIVAIVAAVLYVIEMLSDIGATGLVVRHGRACEPAFLNTVWTVRMLRSIVNAGLIFVLAPWIALLYGDAVLTGPLRLLSAWFLLAAFESMSFALCMRAQRSRVVGFVELGTTLLSTIFVIVVSLQQKDHWGMVYGMLVSRALTTVVSYFVGPTHRPEIALERSALRDIFEFSKFVTPTSVMTMLISQFDRVVFLRLFDLKLLGVYGVAGSVSGPLGQVSTRLSQFVLYPRCAAIFRSDPQSLRSRFYTDNIKLIVLVVSLPAAFGGAAPEIIEFLFDPRYAGAGFVLQMFMFRLLMHTIAGPAKMLLTAVGYPKAPMVANALRLTWLVPGSLLGYYLAGFEGFVIMTALEALPSTAYILWVQHRKGFLIPRYEAMRVAYAATIWLIAYAAASALASAAWWVDHVR